MLTEAKFRSKMDAIWNSSTSPLRKARLLLGLSYSAKALSTQLMDLGFQARRRGKEDKGRLFWATSASLLDLAQKARSQARAALGHRPKPLGFETSPSQYAVPHWERQPHR